MSAHDVAWRQLALRGNASSTPAAVSVQGSVVDVGAEVNADADVPRAPTPTRGLGTGTDTGTGTGTGTLDGGREAFTPAYLQDSREAFTPAFQFSAFRFIQVTYTGAASPASAPDASDLTCYRIGAAFDWIGDVAVAAPSSSSSSSSSSPSSSSSAAAAAAGGSPRAATRGGGAGPSAVPVPTAAPSTTAAERFNTVVAAARSTAISNYLMDVPTDCPHREKRG